jgi:hypothetical protein
MKTYAHIFQSLKIDLDYAGYMVHRLYYGKNQYFIKLNDEIQDAFLIWCRNNNITDAHNLKAILYTHYKNNPQFTSTNFNVLFTGNTLGK